MARHTHSELPEVFTRAEALAAGLSRHQSEWSLRSGAWIALRRGVYCAKATLASLGPDAHHRLHAIAALKAHDERHVLSHASAALTYGLPMPLQGPGRPSLTIDGKPASTDRQQDLIIQVAGLRPQDVRDWGRWRRTSPARTIADCLRHLPAPDAVAMADRALRSGLASVEAIVSAVQWQSGWPYFTRAHRAMPLIDGRRESWLESYSHVVLHDRGIPLPIPQVTILDVDGAFVARVDGLWPGRGVVAESDGWSKYWLASAGEAESDDPAEVAQARIEGARRAFVVEKRREDRLRALGLEIVRWGTQAIVHQPGQVERDIRAAWQRADPTRVTARYVFPSSDGLVAVETGVEGLKRPA